MRKEQNKDFLIEIDVDLPTMFQVRCHSSQRISSYGTPGPSDYRTGKSVLLILSQNLSVVFTLKVVFSEKKGGGEWYQSLASGMGLRCWAIFFKNLNQNTTFYFACFR